MFTKRVTIAVLLLTFFLTAFGCSNQGKTTADTQQKEEASNVKSPVKIYLLESNMYFRNAVNKFKKTYNNVALEETTFTNTEEYTNKLSTELLAGEGPDLVIVDNGVFRSAQKALAQEVFYDLNGLISRDKGFELSNYSEKVLDGGIYNNKRYLIPISYDFPMMYSTKNILHKNGIQVDDSTWTWKELSDAVQKFTKGNQGKEKYFFAGNFTFDQMLRSSGIAFVDYKNKKTKFDAQEFIALLNLYKDISPAICPDEISKKYRSPDNLLKNNVAVMVCDIGLGNLGRLWKTNANVQNSAKEDMEVYLLPPFSKGGNTSVFPMSSVAINAKCKNKQYAWEYIKILLSQQFQEENMDLLIGTPINKKSYESSRNYYTGEAATGQDLRNSAGETFKSVPLPKALIDRIDNLLARSGECELRDREVSTIIKQELPDFLSGKKSAEQTAKAINDKVNLFINE